jgi:aryl carrier-like protein
MQMEAGEAERECSYVGPRNKTEEILVSIWEDVLKQKKIGIHDNFFTLGGDSLRAIKLCSDLQMALAEEKPLLPVLFNNPTIAELAEQLQQNDQISQYS